LDCRPPAGESLAGYTTGAVWNGWAQPHLPLEAAKRLLELCPDWGMTYDAVRDAFILPPHDTADSDESEIYESMNIKVGGEIVSVYAIGAGFWCWEEHTV